MSFEFTTAKIHSVVCDAVVDFIMNDNSLSLVETKKTDDSTNCKCFIHVSIPFQNDTSKCANLIRSGFRSVLKTIVQRGLYTVAIPLQGFLSLNIEPSVAHSIVYEEITEFLQAYEANFLFVVQEQGEIQINPVLRIGLDYYLEKIDQEKRNLQYENEMLSMVSTGAFHAITDEQIEEYQRNEHKPYAHSHSEIHENHTSTVPFIPGQRAVLEESFAEMVFRKIDEKGFKKDSECYSRANIKKSLFSQLRCSADYHPSKRTALALCIALELPLNEAKELLMKAGYSLSHSILSDVIVEYCILNEKYNIYEINELLYDYKQPILGG